MGLIILPMDRLRKQDALDVRKQFRKTHFLTPPQIVVVDCDNPRHDPALPSRFRRRTGHPGPSTSCLDCCRKMDEEFDALKSGKLDRLPPNADVMRSMKRP